MKKTKIVCTMGPNTSDRNLLRDMILAGMDVARFNFSHGDHEEHEKRIETLKELRDELDLPIAMLLDTKGPEIRTGLLKDGKKVNLETGNEFSLYLTEQEGDEHGTSITYQELSKDVKPGDTILIDDGLIGLDGKRDHSGRDRCLSGRQWRRVGTEKGRQCAERAQRWPA